MEITKDDFELYEDVRKTGRINMFNVSKIVELTGLTKEQCFYIMKNYNKLSEEFGD